MGRMSMMVAGMMMMRRTAIGVGHIARQFSRQDGFRGHVSIGVVLHGFLADARRVRRGVRVGVGAGGYRCCRGGYWDVGMLLLFGGVVLFMLARVHRDNWG